MPEQVTTVTSGQGTLSARDAVQGFLMAAIGTAVTGLYEVISKIIVNGGGFKDIDWKLIGLGALAAGLGHIARKFFQPPVIVVTNPTKTEVKAVKEGEATVEVTAKKDQ